MDLLKFYKKFKGSYADELAKKFISWNVHNHESARRLSALLESGEYARSNMKGAFSSPITRDVFYHSLSLAPPNGLLMEFGVWSGNTINRIADHVGSSRTVHGFDSFEGLPEDWTGSYRKGTFNLHGKLPSVRPNVELHVGWFSDTLPKFMEISNDTISFLHIDCDLYSSTKTIFDNLGERLVPGSIILFDEYFNYYGWKDHEHRAFEELIQQKSLEFKYTAYNTSEYNVSVQIIGKI
ncbi:MAG: macrocin-O-methyltransferase family protein [Xanthobacteraceae bacterium]|jgi:hypothetical protein|nr:macrocin-O-methyltransferase family protein [Xanthobacteraceae bacterium]